MEVRKLYEGFVTSKPSGELPALLEWLEQLELHGSLKNKKEIIRPLVGGTRHLSVVECRYSYR